MKYSEWAKKHGHIHDRLKGDMPSEKEIWHMTHDEIVKKFGHKIKKVADELGIDVDEEDMFDIIDRIYGVADVPKLHRRDYDLHC